MEAHGDQFRRDDQATQAITDYIDSGDHLRQPRQSMVADRLGMRLTKHAETTRLFAATVVQVTK